MPRPPSLSSAHLLPLGALASLLVGAVAVGAPPKPRPLPVVPRSAVELDGSTEDWPKQAREVAQARGESAQFTARAFLQKDTLLMAVAVEDSELLATDVLTMTLHFPGAGATAPGYTLRFNMDGPRTAENAQSGPPFPGLKVGAVKKDASGFTVEAALPPRALPRFPAKGPVVLEWCIAYEDHDARGKGGAVTHCVAGSMQGGALRFPDAWRAQLKLSPPKDVDGLEGRPGAWLGFAALRFPRWVQADAAVTPSTLPALVTEAPVRAVDVKLPIPEDLALPTGEPLVAVLWGKDPYTVPDQCNADHELRLGLYLVKDRTAVRVLEWPAITCALGRALSFELDEEGGLSIGYSNGSSLTFTWSSDRFERTELGRR